MCFFFLPGERYYERPMMGTFKFIKGSIMLWSYFRANGMDPLVVVHEKIKLHTPIAKTDAILYREKPSKDR